LNKNDRNVAILCLYISSKYEELDDNIPSAKEFLIESKSDLD